MRNKETLLPIEELKEELSLRFERLSMKSESSKDEDLRVEKALTATQFKGKCRNCGKLGHKAAHCKSRKLREDN